MVVGITIMAFWCVTPCVLLYRNLLPLSSGYMKDEVHPSKIRRTFKMFPESFKLYFFQDLPLVQLYSSASDCKAVGNNFVKTFSAIPLHF